MINDKRTMEVKIDWEEAMANSITSQILNHPHLKENYVRVLAMTLLKIERILRYRNDG